MKGRNKNHLRQGSSEKIFAWSNHYWLTVHNIIRIHIFTWCIYHFTFSTSYCNADWISSNVCRLFFKNLFKNFITIWFSFLSPNFLNCSYNLSAEAAIHNDLNTVLILYSNNFNKHTFLHFVSSISKTHSILIKIIQIALEIFWKNCWFASWL